MLSLSLSDFVGIITQIFNISFCTFYVQKRRLVICSISIYVYVMYL